MSIGFFTEKEHQPENDEILEVLGLKRKAWKELTAFVTETYRPSVEPRFYGKNYGWAMRYRKGGEALL